jgi:[acyl-carrier-protein] S-malonyltransferase
MNGPHLAGPGDVAVLFPGQGSQRVGMGTWLFRELPEMREILAVLSDAAGCDIGDLCARGPLSRLSDTRFTQPAVFAVGIAAYRYLARLDAPIGAFAGHSVGEITAVCATQALTTLQAAALVCDRGRLMATAPGRGRMALITGLERRTVQRCCADAAAAGRVVIAAHNSPIEYVVSGDEAAVARCCEVAERVGARRVVRLKASHAFHSPLMDPVAGQWRRLLGRQTIGPPAAPVILNVTGEPTTDPHHLRRALHRQLTRSVEWWSTMRTLRRLGFRTVIACETDGYLSRIARSAGLRAVSFAEPRRVRDLLDRGRVAAT